MLRVLRSISEKLHYLWLRNEIKKNGICVPVLIAGDGTVIDGRTRIAVSKEIGCSVPYIIIDSEVERCDGNGFSKDGENFKLERIQRRTE